jgi:hypothetical protein
LSPSQLAAPTPRAATGAFAIAPISRLTPGDEALVSAFPSRLLADLQTLLGQVEHTIAANSVLISEGKPLDLAKVDKAVVSLTHIAEAHYRLERRHIPAPPGDPLLPDEPTAAHLPHLAALQASLQAMPLPKFMTDEFPPDHPRYTGPAPASTQSSTKSSTSSAPVAPCHPHASASPSAPASTQYSTQSSTHYPATTLSPTPTFVPDPNPEFDYDHDYDFDFDFDFDINADLAADRAFRAAIAPDVFPEYAAPAPAPSSTAQSIFLSASTSSSAPTSSASPAAPISASDLAAAPAQDRPCDLAPSPAPNASPNPSIASAPESTLHSPQALEHNLDLLLAGQASCCITTRLNHLGDTMPP